MYCFKCGKQLPARVVNCPDCDAPQKRRQRYRRRMILGLFIFLAGAVTGSLFDTLLFKGQAWQHSFLGVFSGSGTDQSGVDLSVDPAANSAGSTDVEPSIVYKNTSSTSDAGLTSPPQTDNIASEATAALTTATAPMATPVASMTVESPVAATAPQIVSVASESVVPSAESNSPVVPKSFPAGQLVYKKTTPLEKVAGVNYHGYMARDGSELIFSSNRQKVGDTSLYQCFSKKPAADSIAERIFAWPGNIWTPETTADNNMVVFSSDSAKPEHLFIYDRKTRNSMPLTSGSSKNMMPALSPDGKLIAFVSNRKGSNNIWLIGIEGANLMQITTGTADDREPRWAPDGLSIVFTRIIEPLKKSYIMKVQLEPLGEPVSLVEGDKRNWLADISPDGSILAFTRSESTDGSKNVLVLRDMLSGKEEIIRPLGGAECFRPIWNADCSGFIFHASGQQGKTLHQAGFARETN